MRKIKIACIIDDDPIFVLGTKRLFEINEFAKEIRVYKNGEEALNALKETLRNGMDLPCIIFLDINMPVMDGWEFLTAFGELEGSQNSVIYMLSSSVDPSDADRARSYSLVRDYLTKPLNQEKLNDLNKKLYG
jgi:CheY-like chemotaxis protein